MQPNTSSSILNYYVLISLQFIVFNETSLLKLTIHYSIVYEQRGVLVKKVVLRIINDVPWISEMICPKLYYYDLILLRLILWYPLQSSKTATDIVKLKISK